MLPVAVVVAHLLEEVLCVNMDYRVLHGKDALFRQEPLSLLKYIGWKKVLRTL